MVIHILATLIGIIAALGSPLVGGGIFLVFGALLRWAGYSSHVSTISLPVFIVLKILLVLSKDTSIHEVNLDGNMLAKDW